MSAAREIDSATLSGLGAGFDSVSTVARATVETKYM